LSIKAYPNPFLDRFTVETHGGEGEVQSINLALHNALGQVVYQANVLPTVTEVGLPSQLPAGVYILRVQAGKEVSETKLVKRE
jgi:hypothetical protein